MSLTMTGFRHKVTENAVYFHGDMNIMKSPCTASHCNQAYSERLHISKFVSRSPPGAVSVSVLGLVIGLICGPVFGMPHIILCHGRRGFLE